MAIKMVINADFPKEKISKNIYGHFAEHLGRCIYGGFLGRQGFTYSQHSME